MPVDWTQTDKAYEYSRSGDIELAIAVLTRLMQDAESDVDRSAITLGMATCYSHVSNFEKSLECIHRARILAGEYRDIMSQIAMSDASLRVLTKEHELACEKFASMKTEYSDLLLLDRPFAIELESRFAGALVDVGRYAEAIPMLQQLLDIDQVPDRQWLQIYLGTALAGTGRSHEAQRAYFAAAAGPDTALAEVALAYTLTAKNKQ